MNVDWEYTAATCTAIDPGSESEFARLYVESYLHSLEWHAEDFDSEGNQT